MTARGYRRSGALAVSWLLAALFTSGPCASQSLFVIPTDSSPSATVADNQPLRIALHVRDPQALAKVLGVAPPAPDTGVLQYVVSGYPAIQVTAPQLWTQPSFVIDYQDPGVERLSAQFAAILAAQSSPPSPPLDALIAFVADTMQGSHNRGFDIASEVAVHREGDCKQFAVLTVALARATGIPARVVLGLALIRGGTAYGAFGHAWAELQIDGRWVVADAALKKLDSAVRYLPFGVLENEGMGYALAVARLTPVWVQRVEVLGSPAASPALP